MKVRRQHKAKSMWQHARLRAAQRYGLDLSNADEQDLVAQIQSGRARFVASQSHRVTLWDVETRQGPARVCYDKQRKAIITFLPREPVLTPAKDPG